MQFFRRLNVRVTFLARYDPRCSPLEHAFNEMKARLRRRGHSRRVQRNHYAAVHAACAAVTAQHARNYFRNCGLLDRDVEEMQKVLGVVKVALDCVAALGGYVVGVSE
jgi:hypothetical protein